MVECIISCHHDQIDEVQGMAEATILINILLQLFDTCFVKLQIDFRSIFPKDGTPEGTNIKLALHE